MFHRPHEERPGITGARPYSGLLER